MAKYELVEYETYGYKEEKTGAWVWDVNNIFKTGIMYEISDTESDREIIKRLCTEEKQFPSSRHYLDGSTNTGTWLKPEAETKVCVANIFTDIAIEIEEIETNEPLGRLELVED